MSYSMYSLLILLFVAAKTAATLSSSSDSCETSSEEISRKFGPSAGTEACLETQAFDIGKAKCYEVGSSGPCGHLASFVRLEANPIFGICVCANSTDCQLPLVYWPDCERNCVHLFTQGPCEENKWLAPDRKLTPRCVPTSCPRNNPVTAVSHSFTFNGTCLFTETQAHCPAGKIARFLDGGLIPNCDDEHSQRCNASMSQHEEIISPEGLIPDSEIPCETGLAGSECDPVAQLD